MVTLHQRSRRSGLHSRHGRRRLHESKQPASGPWELFDGGYRPAPDLQFFGYSSNTTVRRQRIARGGIRLAVFSILLNAFRRTFEYHDEPGSFVELPSNLTWP